ncbi:MAG: hypothetical protein JWM78_1502 [Verrucomicrobiaceae bacterium]|nr:hypothetical protein [Verrucomicrobiaceae bacterium]
MSAIKIGISGWRYPPWRGVFYPKGLKQDRELEFASHALPSIEINGSFYNLQRPENYSNWYAATPKGFVFSVKAPRYITHILRLRDVKIPVANFFASGLFNLQEKLGPILWQFPPSFKFDAELFEEFLALLPRDTEAAHALASAYHEHVKGRAQLDFDKNRRIRHAVEIRNASFIDPQFIALLRKYNVALVVADTAKKWPYYEDITSDFMYLRLHGEAELYASGYTDAALQRWANRIRVWRDGGQVADAHRIDSKVHSKDKRRTKRPIFCYFDNDIKVRAPFDAAALIELLKKS